MKATGLIVPTDYLILDKYRQRALASSVEAETIAGAHHEERSKVRDRRYL